MHLLSGRVFTALLLFGGFAFARNSTPNAMSMNNSGRSESTCADPSLVQTVFGAFRTDTSVHVLNWLICFEGGDTITKAVTWANPRPAFRAWPSQQPFTVPLFQLGTADRTQYIYKIGADAVTPPVVTGFDTDVVLIGWVYSSQVCGSVPLMSAAKGGGFTDHYFTISAFDHDGLISSFGWTDSGVVAFVLPLNDS